MGRGPRRGRVFGVQARGNFLARGRRTLPRDSLVARRRRRPDAALRSLRRARAEGRRPPGTYGLGGGERGMTASAPRPAIAVAACFMHADPDRAIFRGKTLLYTEQKMARSLWRAGALPIAHLDIPEDPDTSARALLERCDGLLLQGGADCAPSSYGESPLRPEWSGDAVRDDYERRLIDMAIEMRLPVLGICRGAQILNVARGGTLYQDITTQIE